MVITARETKVKPGYKQTEGGVIPAERDVRSYSDICVKIQDGTHFSHKLGGNDYQYITSKNIRFGFLDISNADWIDAAQHKSIYQRCDVKYGDLLITKDGANTGNAALNNLDKEFSLLSSVAFLRFDSKRYVAGYFLQQILSTFGQQQIKAAMSANAITRLTLEKIKKLQFPVPAFSEQTAIAAALSDVDALITSLNQLIAKKRDIKQATMQQLLTGKMRLPGFSGEWGMERLGERCEFYSGGTPNTSNSSFYGGNISWITSSDLNKGRIEEVDGRITKLGFENSSAQMVKKGTLLLALYGATAGVAAITEIDAAINQAVLAIISQKDDSEFLFQKMTLLKDWLIKTYTQGGQPNLSGQIVKSIEISLPPKPEQQAIATVLSDMDTEIVILEQKREKTRALKQGMMQELLTGRIRLI